MRRTSIYHLLFLSLLLAGCTNARWMVKDSQTVDPQDYTVLSSEEFPVVEQAPTPEDPVLNLKVMSAQRYEFARKVVMARYVQDYKMRPFFFSLGVIGAATAFYLANGKGIHKGDGKLKSAALNGIGGVLALSTIFNFEPDGEPRPTGEERFLRTTGSVVKTDTTAVPNTLQDSALVDIYYGGTGVAVNEMVAIRNGRMSIPLGSKLSELGIVEPNPYTVYIDLQYRDSTYSFYYPLRQILRPFALVETPVTELRNAPSESTENVLADLIEGSQLQIVGEEDADWYRVLYGISENFISKDDASVVWRTSDFAEENRVVAVPTVPFGEIDVENNIPVLSRENRNGIALLVGNEHYDSPYVPLKYAERDLELIETYLDYALGYSRDRIYRLDNLSDRGAVDSVMTLINQVADDSSEVVVYLGGYGAFAEQGGDYVPHLLFNGSGQEGALPLIGFYRRVSALPHRSALVINNIDFSRSYRELTRGGEVPEVALSQPLENALITITSESERLAVLFSSELDQSTHAYLGDGPGGDRKHHVLPYFFAKALQMRNRELGDIFRYLQRNVSYTSRRIHDEPQDPMIFGDLTINLAE